VADLIDGILPKNRVHLLAGVSDAGKTRWVLPAMIEWQQGNPVFDCASNPVPWAYVVGDRLQQEAVDTLASMGYSPNIIRMIPAFGKHNKGWLQILMAAAALDPIPEFLVVEGFGDLCGEKRPEVREFLGTVGAFCEGVREFPNGLTLLGVVESPKQKPYEKYPNPRQRVSGTSAWGYHTSTILLLEGTKGDDELLRPDRTLWVCLKNGKRRKLLASFDAVGRLIVP
jgi:hypothetical protein